MTDINQNFSLMVANDTEVLFDLGPDNAGINLEFVEDMTWKAYTQSHGIPSMNPPVISKDVASGGIVITDPLLMQFTVEIDGADTFGLSGNYYYEIKIVANHGQLTTTTTGLMTVIDPEVVTNVNAFKAMFPALADMDDTIVQVALDNASQFVDDTWEDSQAIATMYLAAHFLALAEKLGASGQIITSEHIGQISVSYAAATAAATANTAGGTLGQTTYGMMFDSLLTFQGFGIAIC